MTATIGSGDKPEPVSISEPWKMRFPLRHWDRDAFILSYPLMGDEESETFVRFQPDEGGIMRTAVLDLLNADGCGTFDRAD